MIESEELHPTYITTCVFNAYLSYTAIMLNSVTIHALRKAALLPKPLKTMLLSLTVSDLGVGLLAQPMYVAVYVTEMGKNTHNSSIYSTTRTVYSVTAMVLSSASFLGVMAVSADRFLAIHLHLRYQELVTQKRAVAVVISVWMLSTFVSFVWMWIPKNITFAAIFATIAVCWLLITTTLYYKIYAAVCRHASQISQTLQTHQAAQNGEMENAVRQRKTAVGPFFVYLAFWVCYLPNYCSLVVSIISGTSTTVQGWRLYTVTLVFLNSSLNPLIYCWKMRHIRHAFMDTLRNIFRGRG